MAVNEARYSKVQLEAVALDRLALDRPQQHRRGSFTEGRRELKRRRAGADAGCQLVGHVGLVFTPAVGIRQPHRLDIMQVPALPALISRRDNINPAVSGRAESLPSGTRHRTRARCPLGDILQQSS